MKVTVFGGSGRVGHLVNAAVLARGWDVVVYARDRSRLRTAHDRLKVVVGELDDRDAIAEAVNGSDAVISTLGPGFTTWSLVIARWMDNIIAVMQELGVSRLIVLSTPSYHDSRDGRDPVNALVVSAVHVLLPMAWRTIAQTGSVGSRKRAGLDSGESPPSLQSIGFGTPRGWMCGRPGGRAFASARATVAEFLVEQVESPKYLHGAPVISRGADSRK